MITAPNVRQHSLRFDQATPAILYIGEGSFGALDADAAWRIRRLETVGNITEILYADGNDFYDNIWDNRAILTYL